MRTISVLALWGLVTGCDGLGGASVGVAFDNAAPGGTERTGDRTQQTPEYFGMKFTALYLSEDIADDGSNAGNTEMIYVNPACDQVSHCDVGPGPGITTVLDDWFEFSQPTEAVNAQINSQGRTISAGTYRYIRMEWCKGGDGETMRFRAPDMPEDAYVAYNWGGCTTTVETPEPFEIVAGESFTVSLAYDLTDAVAREESEQACQDGNPRCYVGDGVSWWIDRHIEFAPSLTDGGPTVAVGDTGG